MNDDRKQSREVYLARAKYAEEQAAKALIKSDKKAWLTLASSYRELADKKTVS